jgi:CheY-like chemotaxis protein
MSMADRPAPAITGPRVIVVEDEALVALMMEDLLSDLGCEVVATFGGVDQAMAWLAEQDDPPQGALLDINLGGQLVYPLAEALQARHTPFAFATGYGNLRLDPRFADVAVLTKPINPSRLREVVRGFGKGG